MILFAVLIIFSYYLIIFMKAVEQVCMIQLVPLSKITEGDWIVQDVIIKGKKICGPSDLGITDHQIDDLKKYKVKEVLIKQGIPFVPSFLLAFIITFMFGNWFFSLLLQVAV